MSNNSRGNLSDLQQLKRLLGEAGPYWKRLAAAGVCLAIAGAIGLVYPLYFGKVIDAAFTDRDLPSLDASAILLVALFAVQGVFAFTRQYLLMWVGERTVANLRVKIFRHFVTLPQAYFQRTRTGELLSRLSDDVGRLQMVVSVDLSVALRATISLVGAVAIVLATNPKLALLMLAVVPPLAILTRVWGRSIRRLSRRAQDALARAAGGLQESVAAMETVQAFTREKHEVARYGADIESSFGLFAKRALVRALYFSISGFIAFAGIAAIFWLGGRMVAAGEIGPGELTQFLLYTMMIASAVASFAGLVGSLSTAIGSTSRVYEILDEEPDIVDPPGATALEVTAGRVAFENVSFSYPGREGRVLEDVSFSVEPGQICAVVGMSGAGKTTLGRLLLRFYDLDEGRITIDGQPVDEVELAGLRGSIALVAQDPPLFSGPVYDNILYGRLDATRDEVELVAKQAGAHGFITGFADGYRTVVGERGIKLSGGQRQRVAIARAMLRNPRLLLLDEATNALDAESERVVQEALEKLQKGRTTLVIAHRLSTIRGADKIVVLDAGRVAEIGTHDELIAAGGVYAGLVARQAEGQTI